MRSLFLGLLIPLCLSVACGAGARAEDVERSMAEFRLAASLHQEGNTPSALERLSAAIELDPENGEAYVLLGFILLTLDKPTDSEEQLRQGIEVLETQEDVGGVLSEAHNVLGLSLLAQERYDESIAEFQRAASDMLNREPWKAWANLGRAQFEKGALDESVAALLRSVEIQPQFCVGYYLLGQTYFAQDNFEDAETAASSAIESNQICEGYQAAYRLRGEARARLGMRDEAVEDLIRCVQLDDSTDDAMACRRLVSGMPVPQAAPSPTPTATPAPAEAP